MTQLASAAQAEGIRFIGTRNEQAAGYAASAYGYLTGRRSDWIVCFIHTPCMTLQLLTGTPGVLLTVSGPGVVHGIAGLSNAQVNCWPMVMLSGSAEQHEVGKGSFQELDQVAATAPYCKYAGRATTPRGIPAVVAAAVAASVAGRPGAAYVDVPSDVLMATDVQGVRVQHVQDRPVVSADGAAVQRALKLLSNAKRYDGGRE